MSDRQMPIRAVIFDKDGTLHDTEQVFDRAWRLAADEFGVPDMDTTIKDCTGRTLPDIATYWNAKYPDIPFETYIPRRQYYFNAIIEGGIPVKEGAYELLEYLKTHGYHVGLATSTGYEASMEHLRRTGMVDYFDKDAIVTGDMIQNGKPAPDIFLLSAARMGVDPSLCVGVEDSLNGVRAIHAAAMRPVMIPDMIPPTPEVEALLWRKCRDLAELQAIIVERHGE